MRRIAQLTGTAGNMWLCQFLLVSESKPVSVGPGPHWKCDDAHTLTMSFLWQFGMICVNDIPYTDVGCWCRWTLWVQVWPYVAQVVPLFSMWKTFCICLTWKMACIKVVLVVACAVSFFFIKTTSFEARAHIGRYRGVFQIQWCVHWGKVNSDLLRCVFLLGRQVTASVGLASRHLDRW